MTKELLMIALGGGLGSVARYLCQRGMLLVLPGSFPVGTFVVNILGCLLIGIFWAVLGRSNDYAESTKLFLMTGICGGFTTFSAFTLEGVGLIREQKTGLFFLYTGLSVITGLLATWAGIKLMRG